MNILLYQRVHPVLIIKLFEEGVYMTHIQTALTNAVSSFKDLWSIVEKAEADISFWGARYVRAVGYEGRCPLDTLTGLVVEMIEDRRKIKLDEDECSSGRSIKEKIDGFYTKTDQKINEKNILTRLFFIIYECWIRHIHNAGYGPRFDWRSDLLFRKELRVCLGIST